MKKYLSLVLVLTMTLAIVLSFGGCKSNPTSVPDSLVRLEIKDRVSNWDFPEDPQTVITHSYDKDAHTDTVTVEYSLAYTYGTYEASIDDIVFQYDRTSDNWVVLDSGDEHYLSATWNEDKLEELCGSYSGIKSNNYYVDEWSLELKRIDLKNEEVILSGYGTNAKADPFADIPITTVMTRPLLEDAELEIAYMNHPSNEEDYWIDSEYLTRSGVVRSKEPARPILYFFAVTEDDWGNNGHYEFIITPENGLFFWDGEEPLLLTP